MFQFECQPDSNLVCRPFGYAWAGAVDDYEAFAAEIRVREISETAENWPYISEDGLRIAPPFELWTTDGTLVAKYAG